MSLAPCENFLYGRSRNGQGIHTLQRLIAAAADRVLVRNASRTRSWLAAGEASVASVTVDELRYVGERLLTGLAG